MRRYAWAVAFLVLIGCIGTKQGVASACAESEEDPGAPYDAEALLSLLGDARPESAEADQKAVLGAVAERIVTAGRRPLENASGKLSSTFDPIAGTWWRYEMTGTEADGGPEHFLFRVNMTTGRADVVGDDVIRPTRALVAAAWAIARSDPSFAQVPAQFRASEPEGEWEPAEPGCLWLHTRQHLPCPASEAAVECTPATLRGPSVVVGFAAERIVSVMHRGR